ncbi:MAG: tetratricopeptide repeat protein [Segetibacter sp.]|nr:tetratricopeptide repeat protein [Segetibacter sp.]
MKKLFISALFIGFSVSAFSFNGDDSASYYMQKAIEQSQARKVWEADKSFQKAVKFSPSNVQIRLEYGNYLINQRKAFAAVEQFGKVLETNINHSVALEKMTLLSFQLRRWSDVVMYGNKLLKNAPSADVKYMIGKSFYELENYGQSQKYLNEALAQNPRKLETVTLLGKVLIELSNYKQAIAVYNQTLQLDPNNNGLIYELGLLHYTLNQEKEAIKYFELAAEKGYKTDLDYYENLGLAYLDNDLKKGIQTLNKVLEAKPGNAEIMFQIAQAYYKVEKFQDAANTFYKIYQNDPTNSRALYMTGVAFQKKGDKNKGIELCEQAIKMDPNLAQLRTQKLIF